MIELSIIIPFYRRAAEFRATLALNLPWLKPSYEIVLVMDDPEGRDDVEQLMREHAGLVRWRALCNPNAHEWRNPARALNVGIRHAEAEFVLIVSPETRWLSDVPGQLLARAREQPQRHHFGELAFGEGQEPFTLAQFASRKRITCGSLCVARRHLEAVRGYDESLEGWGADDHHLRARLRLNGVHGTRWPEVCLQHPAPTGNHRKHSASTQARMRELLNPTSAACNDENWGRDFDHEFFRA